jgi:CheY-like chemotaxis protein
MAACIRGGTPDPSGVRRRAGRILVVDDEALLGRAISVLLSDAHRVDVTTSAKDALGRLLWGERYDIILCDITMPEMSGVDFYDEVHRMLPWQARRVVFMTGGIPSGPLRVRVAASGRMVLDKPIDSVQLRGVVDAHIDLGPPVATGGR